MKIHSGVFCNVIYFIAIIEFHIWWSSDSICVLGLQWRISRFFIPSWWTIWPSFEFSIKIRQNCHYLVKLISFLWLLLSFCKIKPINYFLNFPAYPRGQYWTITFSNSIIKFSLLLDYRQQLLSPLCNKKVPRKTISIKISSVFPKKFEWIFNSFPPIILSSQSI